MESMFNDLIDNSALNTFVVGEIDHHKKTKD